MDQTILDWKEGNLLLCQVSSQCDCYMLCGQNKNCSAIYFQQDVLYKVLNLSWGKEQEEKKTFSLFAFW